MSMISMKNLLFLILAALLCSAAASAQNQIGFSASPTATISSTNTAVSMAVFPPYGDHVNLMTYSINAPLGCTISFFYPTTLSGYPGCGMAILSCQGNNQPGDVYPWRVCAYTAGGATNNCFTTNVSFQ